MSAPAAIPNFQENSPFLFFFPVIPNGYQQKKREKNKADLYSG